MGVAPAAACNFSLSFDSILLQEEIHPKNLLMIGPTGCGKTEIARRLAKLANAPFVKVRCAALPRPLAHWSPAQLHSCMSVWQS